MKSLSTIVDQICEYHREHDTIEFYFRVQRCMSKCLPFIDQNLLEKDEKEIVMSAELLWETKNLRSDIIKKNHFLVLNRKLEMPKENRNMKRYFALSAIQGAMTSFEAWK